MLLVTKRLGLKDIFPLLLLMDKVTKMDMFMQVNRFIKQ